MFQQLIAKIAKNLADNNLPYMIIGGQAVLLYGEPRLTKDIDITLGVDIDSLDTLIKINKEISLNILPENPAEFVKDTMVLPVQDSVTGIRVDYIFSFTPYEKQAIGRGKKINILGQDVCFTSPEDLIIHKIFSGRPRDLEDARIVLLKNPEMDTQYIKATFQDFDIGPDGSNYLKLFEEILNRQQPF